ncbi:SixA phosphatase family protein [Chthonobacter rhizosphaerae]|uniref:SixA phosphatase family protein n=1 Tax=Chthonobacter rhizosphaerae TaxID=2735553 RepID=UPI0015EEFBD7|nr:histidine phosphatase family protein [Chthonobacter rhizosphaerae]
MARLLLLRHAKSSWDDASTPDFDRPLNIRGRSSAPLMGRHMADHSLFPERILCSSARRTRETLAGLLPHLSGDVDIRLMRSIYQASEEGYLSVLRQAGGTVKSLMLIGHNPGMQDTALSLIGSGNPAYVDEIRGKFPTAGLAVIDFDLSDWSKLAPGTGRIVAFFRPREIEVVGAPALAEADD